jgi:Domain of unknown function (DUF5076)
MSAFNPYLTLPVEDEALEKGGVELLRVGLADKKFFMSVRSPNSGKPEEWGRVLAGITLRLAKDYAANGDLTENEAIAAVAAGFRDSLRDYVESSSSAARAPRAKSVRPLGKAPAKKGKGLAKSKTSAKTPAKVKAASKSASKAVTARKGVRR